jgi:uncharacterized protein
MIDSSTVIILIGVFIIAGTVKGVIGLGLPTISLALLTVAIDLPSAMALMLVPSLVTNVWQAVVGGNFKDTLPRIWPFLIIATATVWIGALSLTRINLSLLSALLGGLLIVYSALNFAGLRLIVKTRHEYWVGGLTGFINGVLTGMTGSFVVPGVMYLQAINLKRDALIQAMGMLFTVSTLALGFSLQQNRFLSIDHGILSFLCLIPAITGMVLGQKFRKRLSEKAFRKVFFFSLFLLGFYIVINKLSYYINSIA